MKQLDDYVEQIEIGLTKDMLDELGWLGDTTRQIFYWLLAIILVVLVLWGIC